jgi:hypothetical protein
MAHTCEFVTRAVDEVHRIFKSTHHRSPRLCRLWVEIQKLLAFTSGCKHFCKILHGPRSGITLESLGPFVVVHKEHVPPINLMYLFLRCHGMRVRFVFNGSRGDSKVYPIMSGLCEDYAVWEDRDLSVKPDPVLDKLVDSISGKLDDMEGPAADILVYNKLTMDTRFESGFGIDSFVRESRACAREIPEIGDLSEPSINFIMITRRRMVGDIMNNSRIPSCARYQVIGIAEPTIRAKQEFFKAMFERYAVHRVTLRSEIAEGLIADRVHTLGHVSLSTIFSVVISVFSTRDDVMEMSVEDWANEVSRMFRWPVSKPPAIFDDSLVVKSSVGAPGHTEHGGDTS